MARGYNALGDIIKATADGADLNAIWAEHQQTLEIQNEKQTSLASLFTHETTLSSELLAQGFGGSEFERASEYGVPQSLRSDAEMVQVGYDFGWYDLAARYTWRFLSEASAAQIAAIHSDALAADNRLVFSKIMGRVFSPATRVNENGAPVHGFWNGVDSKPPTSPNGESFHQLHSHYLTTGTAELASSDLDDLVETVAHHGYGLRQNGDRIIVLANPAEADRISGFRVAKGDKFDAIPTTDAPAFITAETIEGDRPPGSFNGLTVACGYGDAWVVADRQIPLGYVVALATGGPGSLRNPLGLRQHVQSDLQGLVQVPGGSDRYPLIDSYYVRAFGTGVRARGAGAVLQVTAAPSYTAPSAYPA